MLRHNNGLKLLVIGPPRGGFTLLITVLNHLVQNKIIKINRDTRQKLINTFIPLLSDYLDRASTHFFEEMLGPEKYLYNGEFKLLVGGPKWLDKENNEVANIRKYIGIKDKGDFLMRVSHPKCILDYYDVVHSHNPLPWTKDLYYRDYLKFSSIRNPIGILNSSLLSINALTSEYIQRYIDTPQQRIREQLALYKLSNLDFFDGMVSWLKDYFDDFLSVKDDFRYIMRWEDLLIYPTETILKIADAAEAKISESYAIELWRKIDHRNLQMHHTHNFRKGGGKVGDWKNYLLNEHLRIIESHGFGMYLEEFGYEQIWELDESQYTPFQKTLKEFIDKGNIFPKENIDENLFTFAYNKTNLKAQGNIFKFLKTYPKRKNIEISRSTFSDDEMVEAFLYVMDEKVGIVNDIIYYILSFSENDELGADEFLNNLNTEYKQYFMTELGSEYEEQFDGVLMKIDEILRMEETETKI